MTRLQDLDFLYLAISEHEAAIDRLLAKARELEERSEREAKRDAAFDSAKQAREERT